MLVGAILISLSTINCCRNSVQENDAVQFMDRNIDIKSFFTEFPYTPYLINISKDGSKLFYIKSGEINSLMMLDLTKEQDLDKGVKISNVDFAKRSFWNHNYNSKDNSLYWIGDEQNDEIINLYRLNLDKQEIEKLTDVPYIYGWSFNPSRNKIAYIARLGQNENRQDELRVLDLTTLKETILYRDKADFRLTWTDISWDPSEEGVLVNILKNADRVYTNAGYIDFKTQSLKIITDPLKKGSSNGTNMIYPWYNNNTGYFLSDQSGYSNIYLFNKENGKTEQITNYTQDITANWIEVQGKKYLLAVQNTPAGSKIIIIDPKNGKEITESSYDYNLSIINSAGDKVYISVSGVNVVFQLWALTLKNGTINKEVIIDLPKEKKEKLIYSTTERLSIPTFDLDPATGKTRKLHAYLLTPNKPLPKGKEMVMIQSFYGGSNSYDVEHQIFTNAGIYVLSPSPRGTAGFGREFAALNDKDLGGNEIIDIIYCAKYISEKLGIPPERVGVFGMSHGGYATMRLLTFPGEVNGFKASFPFGYGIAVAGFADIIYEHNHSNIPDWTFLEAGDPIKDSVKLKDRSPINHADKICGSLLLIHGNHDNRVNVEGSRSMFRVLTELDKPVEYLEIDGQGHGFKGFENNLLYYKTIFNFLEQVNK